MAYLSIIPPPVQWIAARWLRIERCCFVCMCLCHLVGKCADFGSIANPKYAKVLNCIPMPFCISTSNDFFCGPEYTIFIPMTHLLTVELFMVSGYFWTTVYMLFFRSPFYSLYPKKVYRKTRLFFSSVWKLSTSQLEQKRPNKVRKVGGKSDEKWHGKVPKRSRWSRLFSLKWSSWQRRIEPL